MFRRPPEVLHSSCVGMQMNQFIEAMLGRFAPEASSSTGLVSLDCSQRSWDK